VVLSLEEAEAQETKFSKVKTTHADAALMSAMYTAAATSGTGSGGSGGSSNRWEPGDKGKVTLCSWNESFSLYVLCYHSICLSARLYPLLLALALALCLLFAVVSSNHCLYWDSLTLSLPSVYFADLNSTAESDQCNSDISDPTAVLKVKLFSKSSRRESKSGTICLLTERCEREMRE